MDQNKLRSREFKPDEVDLRICKAMVDDVSQSSREIGEKLGLPHTTVRRRINRLIKNDILHIVAMPNPVALGYEVWVIIELKVRHGSVKVVSRALLKYTFCYLITESIGDCDIILGARFRKMDDLTEFVRNELSKITDITNYKLNFLVHPVRFYDYRFLTENGAGAAKTKAVRPTRQS
jgi:DNA-binding Lrp family transcriptional regulator